MFTRETILRFREALESETGEQVTEGAAETMLGTLVSLYIELMKPLPRGRLYESGRPKQLDHGS